MQTLYRFLFTIFNCFVTPDTYDGADRHFLKVFLETCAPALRPVLNVNSQVKLHFFLQLFETRVCDRIPKDQFDIRKMVPLFGKEILQELKIAGSIGGCKHLELVRVSPPQVRSKHVVICISGFLQEKEDKADTWKNVALHYKHAEVYALSWTACNAAEFFDKGAYSRTTYLKSWLNFANFGNTVQRQYTFAYEQARLSGRLLAIFLLRSKFFQGRAVSMIGFSLGTVAAMHCIRILKLKYGQGFIKAGKIFCELQLWAGAYVIDPKKAYEERMRTAFHLNMINGRISNLY